MEERELSGQEEQKILINLQNQLEKALIENDQKQITILRGRIIQELKKKIKLSENTEKEQLEKQLREMLEQHKMHIESRYKNEYSDEKKTFSAIVKVLPKGVGLSIKKVNATIEELKLAKKNKEKIFKTLETAKDLIEVPGTVVDFTIRFAIRHWYLLLLLLKLPKFDIGKMFHPERIGINDLESNMTPNTKESPYELPAENTLQVKEHATENVAEEIKKQAISSEKNISEIELEELSTEPSSSVADDKTSAEIIDELIEEFSPKDEHIYTVEMQKKTLYRTYTDGLLKATKYNAYPTLKDAVKSLQENGNMSVEEAKEILNNPNNNIKIICGEKGIFETEKEFVDYMTNGQGLQDIDLENKSVEQYIEDLQEENKEYDFELFKKLPQNTMIEKAKEMGTIGVTLLILYEGLQYGLAPATGGASLLLPG